MTSLLVQHVSATDSHHPGQHAKSMANLLLIVYIILRRIETLKKKATHSSETSGNTRRRSDISQKKEILDYTA